MIRLEGAEEGEIVVLLTVLHAVVPTGALDNLCVGSSRLLRLINAHVDVIVVPILTVLHALSLTYSGLLSFLGSRHPLLLCLYGSRHPLLLLLSDELPSKAKLSPNLFLGSYSVRGDPGMGNDVSDAEAHIRLVLQHRGD